MDAYSFEELVAEIGAAFLCSDLNVSPTPRLDHIQYIDSWLERLKTDKRAIFKAAGLVKSAYRFLHRLQDAQTD